MESVTRVLESMEKEVIQRMISSLSSENNENAELEIQQYPVS